MSMYEMDYGNGGGDDLGSYDFNDIDPGLASDFDTGYGGDDFGGDYNDFDSFAFPAQTPAAAPPAQKGILERILGKDLGATFKNNPTMMVMALGFIVVLMYVLFKSGRGGKGGGGKKRRRGGKRKKKGILNL